MGTFIGVLRGDKLQVPMTENHSLPQACVSKRECFPREINDTGESWQMPGRHVVLPGKPFHRGPGVISDAFYVLEAIGGIYPVRNGNKFACSSPQSI